MHCKESPFQPSAAAQRDSLNRRLRGKKDYRVDIQTTKAKPCRVFQSERNNSDLIPRAVAHFPQNTLPQREKRNKTDIFRCVLCGTWVGTGNPSYLTEKTLWYAFFFFNVMNAPHAQLFINWPSFAKRTSADKVTGDRTQHTAPSLGCSWRGIQSRWRWTKRLPWLRFMKALFTLKLEPLWRRESLLFGWCCAGLIYWLFEKNAKSSDSPKPMNTTSK